MTKAIADYALIGDCETAALVHRSGSIDWLCWPRFDSEACFAALLGDETNGCWTLAPQIDAKITRRYRHDTLILETRFETDCGVVTVIDFMPMRGEETSNLIRIVNGERGEVPMRTVVDLRFDYGRLQPWVTKSEAGVIDMVIGPHAVSLESNVAIDVGQSRCCADFTISAGEQATFALRRRPSHLPPPPPLDCIHVFDTTERTWREWASHCSYEGPWRDTVVRSLITMKGLTSQSTAGIVAAPTTSLPEKIGSSRNWDYRYCWLRDATFTLLAMMQAGFYQEAAGWRDWLLRAVAGTPGVLQPLFGIDGEHRLTEWEVDWLPGFGKSQPVRVGNAAYTQFQLDVYGEVIDALFQARKNNLAPSPWTWQLQRQLIDHVEQVWQEPDEGIWEVRHGREHFTHSRVLAWVAVDRAVRAGEEHKLDWPLERWRKLRDDIHREVCTKGFDPKLNCFVRSYETREPDAATLLIPLVGFLPPEDPRVTGTIAAIEKHLMFQGFVLRYDTHRSEDGLPEGEGAFLACSFWYIDNLVLQHRYDEAKAKFEELLALTNDVGLLSEEYDPRTGTMLGNFPQALSHLSIVTAAFNLAQPRGPARKRAERSAADGPSGPDVAAAR